jgi:TonB family protein
VRDEVIVSNDVYHPSRTSGRWSPSALALSVLLHGLIIALLWYIAMHPPHLPQQEEPIEVTIEQPPPKLEQPPKPPPPPPPPKPKAEAMPLPPPIGIAPPADIIADKPSQKPSTAKQAQEALAPQPPSLERAVPPPDPPTTAPPNVALAEPAPAPKPDLPGKTAPPKPALAPSPLNFYPTPQRTAPQRQSPALASREEPAPSPFVNPADAYARARVKDNYLWQVVARLRGYRFNSDASVRESLAVVRIVIARDGRLLSSEILRSSGIPSIDRGVLAGVRSGSPYAPLPPDIKGDSASFDLPLIAVSAN